MKNKKGFTLVELIIVITILAILSTISFASYMHYTAETRNVVRIQVGKNIENGLNIYVIDKAKYPEPDIPSFEISYGEEKVGTHF